MARLGKWTGYSSQGPPGYITIKKGMDIFYIKYDAFELALDELEDVYKE
ncbi:MAG: hypothetical protein QM751_12440 [Paludibacteraceae bacterium]